MTNIPTRITFGTFEEELEELDRVLPEDEYDLKFFKYTYKEAKESGNPRVIFAFEVVNHPDPKINGAKLFHNVGFGRDDGFFMKAVMAIAKEDVKYVDIDLEDVKEGVNQNLPDVEDANGNMRKCLGLGDFYGNVCTGRVTTRKYEDREQNNISEWLDLRRGRK